MSRMDVEGKLLLMKLYKSYWLMLPYELQEYILVFKINQEVIEERKKERSVMLCNEIVKRHQLKVSWGLGPICCKVFRCKCNRKCKDNVHLRICGVYYDQVNVKNIVFLGHSMSGALQRVNHVKSFL